MAMQLQTKVLDTLTKRVFEDNVFEVQPDELIELDKDYSLIEKMVTDKQFNIKRVA